MKQKKNKDNKEVNIKRITLDDIKNEHFEIPIEYNGKMLCYLTTDFLREDYFELFNKYDNLPYPILVDPETDMPLLDEKNEPLLDYKDYEITIHNNRNEKLRTISMLKLFSRGLDLPETEDECIKFLDNIDPDLYFLFNQKISEIIKCKFVLLEEKRQKMLKHLMAVSFVEKKINDEKEKQLKHEIEKLNAKNKALLFQLKNAKEKDLIEKIENDIKKNDKELESLKKQIVSKKEECSYRAGMLYNAILIKTAQINHWNQDFTMKVLFGNLTEEEHLYVQICMTDFHLNNSSEREAGEEMEKNRKDRDKGKRTRGD
jgi:hypothetical protein